MQAVPDRQAVRQVESFGVAWRLLLAFVIACYVNARNLTDAVIMLTRFAPTRDIQKQRLSRNCERPRTKVDRSNFFGINAYIE